MVAKEAFYKCLSAQRDWGSLEVAERGALIRTTLVPWTVAIGLFIMAHVDGRRTMWVVSDVQQTVDTDH